MIFQYPGSMLTIAANDSTSGYKITVDTVARRMTLVTRPDTARILACRRNRLDASHLSLTGPLGQDSVTAVLRRVDERAFMLKSRGFHWINELPFNR